MSDHGLSESDDQQSNWIAVVGATYGSRMRSKGDFAADVQQWVEKIQPWDHATLVRLTANVMALVERVELRDFDDYPAGRENGWSSFVNDLDFILDEGIA